MKNIPFLDRTNKLLFWQRLHKAFPTYHYQGVYFKPVRHPVFGIVYRAKSNIF